MILFSIFCLISAIETLSLCFYYFSIKSNVERVLVLGLSTQRLSLLILLLVFSFLFIYFLIYSLKKPENVKLLIRPILENEEKHWIIFTILILCISFLFWLLTRQKTFFGDFQMMFIRLEPFLVLLIVLFFQLAWIIGIRYCFLYIVGNRNQENFKIKKEVISLFIAFLFFIFIKQLIVTSTAYGPVDRGDEMTYFDMAESLYRGFFTSEQSNHYPPLYPLLLTLAFPFKGLAFEGIKIINNILSTSIIFPIYFITRQFIDFKKSIIIILITCLIPYHIVFPRQILSENLFYPLFLWAMFITFSYPINKRFCIYWDILNGIFIGLMYLTRYITLATIPFFFLAWLLKNLTVNGKLTFPPYKLINLFFIGLSLLLVFCPWVIQGLNDGVPFKILLGFGITSRTSPDQLTFVNLLIWGCLYLAYILLIASPVLPLIINIIHNFDWKKWNDDFSRWILQTFLLMAGFFIAVVRHSWRAFYNAEIPSGIMGRYLIVFSTIFIITTLIGNEKSKLLIKPTLLTIFKYFIIPFLLVLLSYLVIIKGKILPSDGELMKYNGSADGFYVKLLGTYYFLMILILYLITYAFLFFKNKKAFLTLGIGLMLYYSIGYYVYTKAMISYQTYPWLSKQISELIPKPDPVSGEFTEISVFLTNSRDYKNQAEIYNGLRIRGIDNTKLATDTVENIQKMETSEGFIIKEINLADFNNYSSEKKYYFNGNYFLIKKITF